MTTLFHGCAYLKQGNDIASSIEKGVAVQTCKQEHTLHEGVVSRLAIRTDILRYGNMKGR